MIKRFLFPAKKYDFATSLGLLFLRFIFGGMLMLHGWEKLTHFEYYALHFTGGEIGLGLVVFAEFFCAFSIIIGLLHRLALLPPIISMGIAFFVSHHALLTGKGNGEIALLYLAVFVAIYFMGVGKFSLDYLIAKK